MSRCVALVVLAAAAAISVGCATNVPAPVGHAELDAIGGWTGAVDPNGNGIVRMSIDEQSTDGTEFSGELELATSATSTAWSVHAALTPHGHLVISAGDAVAVEAHITGPSTLDYCLTTYGVEPVYVCGRLVRDAGP